MLVYATRVYTQDLNKEILIQMVLDWMNEKEQNRMEGLNFNNIYPFTYEYNNKKIFINDYEDRNIIAIRFLNEAEDIHMKFNVDLIFHNVNKAYLDLHFYKEMDENSIFISNVSIPKIYRTILKSKYVIKDNEISYYDEPRKISNNLYYKLASKKYNLPILIVHSYNQKLEKELAWNLFGNAHVYYRKSDKDIIEIVYPGGRRKFYSYDDYKKLSYILREFNITHFYNVYMSFDGLIQEYKKRDNNLNRKESNQYKGIYYEDIKKALETLNKKTLEYSKLLKENEKLEIKNKILEKELKNKNKSILSVDAYDKKDTYTKFMIHLLKQNPYMNNSEERYRKADIIASILEKEEQE